MRCLKHFQFLVLSCAAPLIGASCIAEVTDPETDGQLGSVHHEVRGALACNPIPGEGSACTGDNACKCGSDWAYYDTDAACTAAGCTLVPVTAANACEAIVGTLTAVLEGKSCPTGCNDGAVTVEPGVTAGNCCSTKGTKQCVPQPPPPPPPARKAPVKYH